mmetsp:Transcript_13958/g.37806  ORF Transcript_13958/g.37806 Transcript_13958/m.37806 type:complete len:336 (+) Transcript_13958:41-1048(+)
MSAAPASAPPPLLLAAGILSAPEYLGRRQTLRTTWLPHASPRLLFRFVVRVGGLARHEWLSFCLSAEQRRHGDLHSVQVAWNETRQRGPVLSLVAWLRHAATALAHARFIAKLDDDFYMHVPTFEREIEAVSASLADETDRVYLGFLTWHHWRPEIFAYGGWGTSYHRASSAQRDLLDRFRNPNSTRRVEAGEYDGPFPLAGGVLIVLGRGLNREISRSRIVTDDVRRLRAMNMFSRDFVGQDTEIVFEDIWLASVLHRMTAREMGRLAPVRYVQVRRREYKSHPNTSTCFEQHHLRPRVPSKEKARTQSIVSAASDVLCMWLPLVDDVATTCAA